MSKREMSEFEYTQAQKLIHRYYEIYGHGLDYEECMEVSWCAYVEVRQYLLNIYNTQNLWLLAQKKIMEELKGLRKIRNDRCAIYSKLSLNQTIGESDEPVYTFLFPASGDFVNGICLWDYVKRVGHEKERLVRQLYRGEDSLDIMEYLHIEKLEYYKLILELREDFLQYLED